MITYILKGHNIKTEKDCFILSEYDFIKKQMHQHTKINLVFYSQKLS